MQECSIYIFYEFLDVYDASQRIYQVRHPILSEEVRCHPKFVMKRTKVSTDILIIVDSLLIHCQWHAKQSASSINFQPTTISTNHVTSIIYFRHLLQL